MKKGLPRIIGRQTSSTMTQLCRSHQSSSSCDIQVRRLNRPSQGIVLFRRNDSAGHHIKNNIGPFRHDDSAGRSQRVKHSAFKGNQAQYSSRKETKSVRPIVDRRCALATTHGRGLPTIDCATWPFGAALVDDRGAPDCTTMRALAVRASARRRRTIALHHASAAAHCHVDCATGGRRSAAAGRRWCALAAQASRRWLRALACGVARCRRVFVVVEPSLAAAPASLRRCHDGWSDFF
ncbi:hypothetical protein F511_29306 [Dorcoceras hygrometricum]|uniref:Uncharacterized protein n=1 Tax=Dorcoceras hygrometricum TaxID=472368 RepID=A0A2Z7D8J9_9LAMI|nr:hypothetical protein F511_29306 [Dorcoceras hygrometricum]